MIAATAILIVALAAPDTRLDEADGKIAEIDNRAETLVQGALEAASHRIAVLTDLRRRRAAGETVSLDMLRGARRAETVDSETLSRELARVEELKDAIRVAETSRPRPETPEDVKPIVETAESADPTGDGPRVAPTVPASIGPREIRLADARYRAEEYVGALAIYEKAAASGDTWASLRQARCLEHLGRVEDARKVYQALVDGHPEDRWIEAARWSLRVMDLSNRTTREEGDAR